VSHVIGQGFLTMIFIGFYIGKTVVASAYRAVGSLLVVIAWIYYFRIAAVFWRGIHASLRAHAGL
jgi:uncharacterized BrkB/YihY/UPF0761 family membrane protein